MVRSIIALMVAGVCGVASATEYNLHIFEEPAIDADLQPGDIVRAYVSAYMVDVAGSFDTDTAQLTGILHPNAGGERFAISLRNDVSWLVTTDHQVGNRKYEAAMDDDEPPVGHVGIIDMNAVRNDFGSRGSGDVNYSGNIDITDLNLVRNHFGEYGGWSWNANSGAYCRSPQPLIEWTHCRNDIMPPSAIPEPSTALLLMASSGFVLLRRRPRSA